jgi:hypothetical protein
MFAEFIRCGISVFYIRNRKHYISEGVFRIMLIAKQFIIDETLTHSYQ